MPPIPSSYRSEATPSPASDSDLHSYPFPQRCPSPPSSAYRNRSPQSVHRTQSPPTLMPIRPPPAVARIAGKEKKKHSSSSGGSSSSIPPTSHPIQIKESQGLGGIMSWGKKDTKNEPKWESGVIGRERARIVIDGSHKR